MSFKKFKKIFFLTLALFIIPINTYAYSNEILVSGENIGIEINTKGILVVGTYKVNNKNIAVEAGIKPGDIITSINDTTVSNIDEMVNIISSSNDNVKITYIRNKKEYQATLEIEKDNDEIYKTGLYVKDSITGIGTLTYIDPNTKIFGALGHEIDEQTTGTMLEIKDGKIFSSTVTSIDRSSNGEPGAKNATLNNDDIKGNILENTEDGIFGKYNIELPNLKKYIVASPNEVKEEKATILTVLNDNEVKEYAIKIIKINKNSTQKTKNILFEITDEELLEKTGGVVQGMSGSPIIQNDKIVGAVTHVVVNNPKRGYGIFITNMLEEGEN